MMSELQIIVEPQWGLWKVSLPPSAIAPGSGHIIDRITDARRPHHYVLSCSCGAQGATADSSHRAAPCLAAVEDFIDDRVQARLNNALPPSAVLVDEKTDAMEGRR